VTNADGYSSSARYDYDFGATTWKQTPQPNTIENLPGPEQKFSYDSFGRIERVTNLVNNAYTRYEYPLSQTRVDNYATIQERLGEAHSFKVSDGHGRVDCLGRRSPRQRGRLQRAVDRGASPTYSYNGPHQTTILDGTFYDLWYGQAINDMSFSFYDEEVSDKQPNGVLKTVQWMNAVRLDVAKRR